jgi:hypothetical protein
MLRPSSKGVLRRFGRRPAAAAGNSTASDGRSVPSRDRPAPLGLDAGSSVAGTDLIALAENCTAVVWTFRLGACRRSLIS